MGIFDRFRKRPEEDTNNAVPAAPVDGAVDGFVALGAAIGKKQVEEATRILQTYKQGKANLEKRIVENEQWYRMRHWEHMEGKKGEVAPPSGWLFNSLLNKHADALDNYPRPNILPREPGDKKESEMLSDIVPVVLEHCEFEQTYSDVWYSKLKSGTGVYGVFWDSTMNNIGDVSVRGIDIINLFWEPGITDIQKSRHLFHVELCDNDLLEEEYPQCRGKLTRPTIDVAKYIYDDTIPTDTKSAVVDWYYHKNVNGRKVLHFCKFVGNIVLFASENEPEYAERGWYDHGKYPFVFDVMFPVAGSPAGFGFVDVARPAQEYIDRGNQAILRNMLANARPRYFVREGGEVNEAEFADMSRDFIHVKGASLGDDSIRPVQGATLPGVYVDVVTNKIEELKEVTGNRDVSTGGTTSGVTAAASIAALQEAGSKLSRDSNKSAYRAYREICLLVIELIRQFYDISRQFRIVGQDGAERYVAYSNVGIVPQYQGNDFGVDTGYRVPLFDISVSAEKQSPYSRLSQNELALQFYNVGLFAPQNADMALCALDIMDFDGKHAIMQKISENGAMYQQMQAMKQEMVMLAQMVDASRGSNIAEQLTARFSGGAPVAPVDGNIDPEAIPGGDSATSESVHTKKARQRVAESTSPV